MKKKPRKRKLTRAISHARQGSLAKSPCEAKQFAFAPRRKVRVIGIGGGGGNIVAEVAPRVSRIDFVAANTDTQALRMLPSRVKKMNFGLSVTRGLGCGMDADLGERAAREEKEKIKKLLQGQDVCIVMASLGGGTGSGASPVFCQVARELHVLTIGIFTMPFGFEGKKREFLALQALEKLQPLVNAYILIPNEKIFQVVDKETPLQDALSSLNKRLAESIGGLIETIYSTGMINIDFADVKTVLEGRGKLAYLHSVIASGSSRSSQSLSLVLSNPLSSYDIRGAERILFNIASDRGLKMREASEISSGIGNSSTKAKIIFGIAMRPDLKDKIRITVFAVGCKEQAGEKLGNLVSKSIETKSPKKTAVFRKVKLKKAKVSKKVQQKTEPLEEQILVRRNALDLKNETDKEVQDIEEQERRWDAPAFLRLRSHQDSKE